MGEKEVLRMNHIMKVYSNGVMANKDVTLCVNQGEIHALSGENGAGKSTLMKILFGEEMPTRGEIFINGEPVHITSPTAAIKLGIGMVHQHFMLVDSLSAMENMILGIEPVKGGVFIDRKKAEQQVLEISQKYSLHIEPNRKVRDLTVGQRQKLEILKALLRGVKILILDEPTAVLTPQETQELFVELKGLRENGYTIIFISHKLGEVRELCDRITIIRRGETMGVYNMSEVDEQEISRLMVGRDVELKIEKTEAKPAGPALCVRNLRILSDEGREIVKGVSFTARKGEIIGLAGVEGNGQAELVRAITGLGTFHEGTIEVLGKSIKGLSIRELRKLSISHIPEDRMTTGISPNLSITENMIADKVDEPGFSRMGTLYRSGIKTYGDTMVKEYGIFAKNPDVMITSLSGGNIQKAVLARELSSNPQIIVANQPTRGVDVGAAEFIRKMLVKIRDSGKTIFLISSDLNEILGLSDRLMVMFEGEITAYFPDTTVITEVDLGRYMLGVDKQTAEQVRRASDD